MKFYRVMVLFLAVSMILSACNLPTTRPAEQTNLNAVFTAAAQTVEVQLTQNALLNPPGGSQETIAPPINPLPDATEQPVPLVSVPSNTVSPALATPTLEVGAATTTNCDAAQFVTDVSIPDGTLFTAGATFTKTWRLKNVGTCTWGPAYALVFDSGDAMGGANSQVITGSTAPGAIVDVSVNLQAPATAGTYRGYWGLVNASGARIPVAGASNGKSFFVEVKVATGASSNGTENPGKFAVTSVVFTVSRSEACASATGKYLINATITTNKTGIVTYSWIRSDAATESVNSGTLSFDSPGSKTISYEWISIQSNLWVDLYIDNPNHQQFGRATLNCP
jgi:hypothetical protein